jgi:hypothetical protein
MILITSLLDFNTVELSISPLIVMIILVAAIISLSNDVSISIAIGGTYRLIVVLD